MGGVQQLGFEGMPRRLYTCTPTRLSTWLDCPRRYRMSYLDRPAPGKGPPWAHNSLGASVHNALAGWWRLPLRERTVPAAGGLLERGWIGEGYADSPQSARYRAWARAMVEAYVAGLFGLSPAHVHEVVTFYTLYFREPRGRHVVAVCHNLSCHLAGAQDILRHLEARLGVQRGKTTDDGRVTLQAVECLCACEAAPMMQVDDRYEMNLTPDKVDRILEGLR